MRPLDRGFPYSPQSFTLIGASFAGYIFYTAIEEEAKTSNNHNKQEFINKRLEISADKVLRRLEARASFNMTDLYTPDGSFIPLHELDPDVAIGIKSIEVAELFAGQGEQKQAIGIIRKITCFDGKASDELLGKHLKLWKETGSDDNPLVIINKIELVPLTSSKKS